MSLVSFEILCRKSRKNYNVIPTSTNLSNVYHHLLKFSEDLEGIFLEVCHEMKGSNDGPWLGPGKHVALPSLLQVGGPVEPAVEGQQSCQNGDQS